MLVTSNCGREKPELASKFLLTSKFWPEGAPRTFATNSRYAESCTVYPTVPSFFPSVFISFFYIYIYLSIYVSIYLSIYLSIYHLSIISDGLVDSSFVPHHLTPAPLPNLLLLASFPHLKTFSNDQSAKDKALQSMAAMSSSQIVSATALHNKGLPAMRSPYGVGAAPVWRYE